jgi:F-type H+-transporting ATPase subunit gamma
MASAREIKRRMKSVKNIMQVTMALEAVSASRVRRATAQVTASRAYANLAMEVLSNVAASNQSGTPLHPLLAKHEGVGTVTVLLITSDRGLAGAYNSNIVRVARQFARDIKKPVRWVAVGRKGRDSLLRAKQNLVGEFTPVPAEVKLNFVRPVARLLIDDYLNGYCDEVYIAYTDLINTLTQRPRVQRLLPLIPGDAGELGGADYMKVREAPKVKPPDYIYEPSAAGILDEIVPKFTELVIFQSLLESVASEHSARMVAMRNASESAKDLTNELQLFYNKARQAAITGEILDIVGGVEALRGSSDRRHASEDAASAAALAFAQTAVATAEDDLTVIEGIGPKIAAALNAVGITNFAALANASEAQLKDAIETAGLRLAPTLGTWAEQATFAATGDFEGLQRLQSQIGRKN